MTAGFFERHYVCQPQRLGLVRCSQGVWPHKMLCNQWKRWGERRVLFCMMESLATESATSKIIMIDTTYLNAHRAASSLRVNKVALGTSLDALKEV